MIITHKLRKILYARPFCIDSIRHTDSVGYTIASVGENVPHALCNMIFEFHGGGGGLQLCGWRGMWYVQQ